MAEYLLPHENVKRYERLIIEAKRKGNTEEEARHIKSLEKYKNGYNTHINNAHTSVNNYSYGGSKKSKRKTNKRKSSRKRKTMVKR